MKAKHNFRNSYEGSGLGGESGGGCVAVCETVKSNLYLKLQHFFPLCISGIMRKSLPGRLQDL
jgi:hypothetical protein